jgi:hypothetical protein
MNDALKVVIACSLILFLFLGNAWLFDAIFGLNMAYLVNTFISVISVILATAVEIAAVRVVMGKLKIRVIWE